MTRQQYLSKLRKQLQFKLSNSEIADIISDIEECFDAGAAEGKSEEEICLSLGEPKSAAASLLNEQSSGERVTKLTELWLPVVISAVLFAIYTYFGFKVDIDAYNQVMPIMYILPLIMWVMFERKSFFTALSDYKCDFFTFLGSIFMIAAGLACNEMPKYSLIKSIYQDNTNMRTYTVLTAIFVSAAMILLAVSLWKNAPKFFTAIPLIGIAYIVYNSAKICNIYYNWDGDRSDTMSLAGVGGAFSNILMTIFICATVFLIWSYINRNALTLASAYSAMTVTGFIFYWYNILSTLDPSDKNLNFLFYERLTDGKNFVLFGAIIAAAVLVLTIISKLAKRKKVG